MLPLATVDEIRRLLDEGELSQRKIAKKLGVSRGTVGAIASGRRGHYGREPEFGEPELYNPDLPPERCPTCGGMVYMPCALCRTRRYVKRRRNLKQITSCNQPIRRRVA